MDRTALRRQLRAARRALPLTSRLAFQQQAQQHLLQWMFQRDFVRIAGYVACGTELDLAPALHALAHRGTALYLPAVTEREHCRMVFRRWNGDPAALLPDVQGILAPGAGAEQIEADALELVLVPGVGFDRNGQRLGSGAGYYDRAFAFRLQQPPPPFLFGCGFAVQHVAALDGSTWDVPMDALLDERGIVQPATAKAAEKS